MLQMASVFEMPTDHSPGREGDGVDSLLTGAAFCLLSQVSGKGQILVCLNSLVPPEVGKSAPERIPINPAR